MPLPLDFRFSASGVQLGERCERAWAYCYLDGLRRPEVRWADVTDDTPTRDRSCALGTEVHTAFETWYARGQYDWATLPGLIAISGQHHVPHPDVVSTRAEGGRRRGPGGWAEIEGKLPRLVTREGGAPIVWNGRMDLLVSSPREFLRMGINPYADTLLVDFKSTSSIAKWAPSSRELAGWLQPNLYGLAVMVREDFARIDARWLYVETKRTRKSHPVDVTIERTRAEDVVGEAANLARRLALIPSSDAATPNTAACHDYGGCEYHASNGGPCTARRSVGALMAARRKPITTEGITPMALPADTAARLAKFKKPGAPANDNAKPAPSPAPAAEAAPEEPAAEAAPRGRGRPPGAKNKPKPKPAPAKESAAAPVAARERTQQLLALTADLAAAEAAELEAAATREAIESAIRELMA